MLLNWCRTSLLHPVPPPLIYVLLIPWKKIPENKEALNKYKQLSTTIAMVFGKCSSRKWFQEGNNLCTVWLSECLHFFPYDSIVNSVLDRRETDRSLKWFPGHPESAAELPDSQTGAPSMIKMGRRIESFFQSAGLWGCSLAKLKWSLERFRGFYTRPWKGIQPLFLCSFENGIQWKLYLNNFNIKYIQ